MDFCIKCGAEKNPINFYIRKDDGFAHCRHCKQLYRIKNRLRHILWMINARCEGRTPRQDYLRKGIKNFLTLEDLQQLWDRDNAHLLHQPSIDRKNNHGDYEFDNCQFIEKIENTVKNKRKVVIQLSKNNEIINAFISVIDAAKKAGISQSFLSMILNGKRKNTTNFNWEFDDSEAA